MAKTARDYFKVPSEAGYYITEEGAMRDAARPYLVMERYYAGYKALCYRTQYRGRYATLEAAKRRVRHLECNDL